MPPFRAKRARWTRDEWDQLKQDEVTLFPSQLTYSTKKRAQEAYREAHPFESRAGKALDEAGKRLETAGGEAAARVAKRVVPAVAAAAPAIASAAATGAGLIAAGALSYFVTRYSAEGARLGREAKVQLVNQLYRDAVSKMRRELGRNPTAAEIKPLAAQWRLRLAEAEANQPVMLRPGRE